MARQYPIWNRVQACIYKSFTGWGVKDTGNVDIMIGSSSSNSYDFLNHCVTKRDITIDDKDYVQFAFSVDGVIIKTALFTLKNGRAKDLIDMKTKLKRIKSLPTGQDIIVK